MKDLANKPGEAEKSKHVWLWALLGILVVTTVSSSIVGFALIKKRGHQTNVKASASAGITPINLTAHYDDSGAWQRPGEWEDVPHGTYLFGGVPFEANGVLRIMGEGARKDKRGHREKVEGIVVGKKFDRLHLLHTAHYPVDEETPYAQLVLHYADGTTTAFQMIFGRHARDWWRSKSEADSTLSDPNSKVVWRGDDAGLKPRMTRRLFKTTFVNPRPHEEVAAIDVASENTKPNMTLIAMSVGPSGLPSPQDDPPGWPEPEEDFEGAMQFSAVGAEDGKPVANVRLKISGNEADGSFRVQDVRTDAQGQCVIKHPGGTTTSLTLLASGPDVAPTRIRWQLSKGDQIPSAYVFRVSRPVIIGGTVRDENGQPIADAKVLFRDYAFANTPTDPREKYIIHNSFVTTGSDGGWEYSSLPPRFRDFSLSFSHPDFSELRFITDGVGRGFQNLPMSNLTSSNAVVHLRKKLRVLDSAGLPIMDNILAEIAAGQGGIQKALPWWKELSSGRRNGIHDPSTRPGAYGIAWGVKGYDMSVVVFQRKQALNFELSGWYVLVGAPENGQFSPEDMGRIMANWLEKTYGNMGTMQVRVLQ